MRFVNLVLFILGIHLFSITSAMAGLFAVNGSSELVSIDAGSGIVTVVGTVTDQFSGTYSGPLNLTYDPIADKFYSVNSGRFIAIDPATALATRIVTASIPGDITGLAFDPNSQTLYGTDGFNDNLITIDTGTGVSTVVGALGSDGLGVQGLTFDPGTGTLFGADFLTDQLLSIDTTSGAASIIAPLGSGFFQGLAFDPTSDTLFGYDVLSGFYGIDTSTGAATLIGPAPSVAYTFNLAFSYEQQENNQVPEPGVLAILGFGLAGLGFARRKRAA